MPDYQQMYLTMMRASERAIQILIDAQNECAQQYMDRPSEPLHLLLPRNDSIFCPACSAVCEPCSNFCAHCGQALKE